MIDEQSKDAQHQQLSWSTNQEHRGKGQGWAGEPQVQLEPAGDGQPIWSGL